MTELLEILNDYRIDLTRDQLHVSRNLHVTPTLIRSPSPRALSKPEGFWTSSAFQYDNGFTSPWYEYAKKRFKDRQSPHGFVLSIRPNAFVFSTDGLKDFKDWCVRNERLKIDSFGSKAIYPWDELTRYVDGVHCMKPFADWPTESTVWNNGAVLKLSKTVILI